MMKIIYSIIVLIVFTSLSHQSSSTAAIAPTTKAAATTTTNAPTTKVAATNTVTTRTTNASTIKAAAPTRTPLSQNRPGNSNAGGPTGGVSNFQGYLVESEHFVSLSLQQSEPPLARCKKASAACILTPEQTQGPYYWDSHLVRRNISEDRSGIRFRLEVLVLNVDTCQPISNAIVDLWHCDALGIYSHYIQASQNIPNSQNDNQTFLRGLQITNNDGIATFDTIYPGWYVGRTIHMHIKVHLGGTYDNATSLYSGGTDVHTGQLFFNDTFSDLVAAQSPYSSHTVIRTLNSQDNIYAGGGSYTLMNIQYENLGLGFSGGLSTTVTLGISSSLLSSDTTTASTVESTEPFHSCGSGRVGGRLFWFG